MTHNMKDETKKGQYGQQAFLSEYPYREQFIMETNTLPFELDHMGLSKKAMLAMFLGKSERNKSSFGSAAETC